MSSSLSKSANQFAADLFQCYLSRHGDKYKNLLLCPYLIYHSLAMMLVGAKGDTAKQLMKLLRIQPRDEHSNSSSSSSGSGSLRHQLNLTSSRIRYLNRKASPSPSSSSIGSAGSSSSMSSIAQPVVGSSRRHQAARCSPAVRPRPSACQQQQQQAATSNGAAPNGRTSSNSLGGKPAQGSEGSVRARTRQLAADGQDEARHREFLMLTEQLLHGNHEFVHLASFIYLDRGTKRTERYKAILRDYYETKPKKVDFDNVDLVVKTVNEDVSRTTENIYNDILSKQEAQKMEKSYMLLVNAVFFRGFWLSNFTDVKRSPFYKYQPTANQSARAQQQQQQQTTTTTTTTESS